jgi:SAM-dependent methyltransferase
MTESTPHPFSFEPVQCDNCGGRESRRLFSGRDLLLGMPGEFTFVECLNCGWMRQDPRPVATELSRYYPDSYLPYAQALEDERWPWRRWDRQFGIIKRCRSIERYAARGRLLEVGCGTGIFLNEMRRRGWDVAGIEPSSYASGYARQRFGVKVFDGPLERYDEEAGCFDVVALWNVLEHLPHPAKGIVQLQRLLKPGGLLVISVPNYEGLDRYLFGASWIGWDLPRHLYVFPRKGLADFFEAHHLRVLDRASPAGSYHAFLLSLQFWLRNRRRADAWKSSHAAVALGRSLPFRLLNAPIFRLVDAVGLSSVITHYVRNE